MRTTGRQESGAEEHSEARSPTASAFAGPGPPADRRTLIEETLVVLSLSLLAAAAFAILDFTRAPVNKSVARAIVSQAPRLADQIVPVLFALAPVWLVFYLLRRNGESASTIGMALDRPWRDLATGAVLAAIVGGIGVVAYVVAVRLGVNRFVVPTPPLGLWWTYPILVLNAAQNALLEETVVLGFLVTRLRQIGWAPAAAVGASALLRGSYHLYQGWGGFLGNLAMGLFFGWLFLRWRRTWPMVFAHTLVDVGAGVLYILFNDQLLRLLRIA
jgi:membrane protease YdiL (CAAX protease family)